MAKADPFHILKRQRQRMAAAAKVARAIGRPDLADAADAYAFRLHKLASMCLPADYAYLSGAIGKNGMADGMRDISVSIWMYKRLVGRRANRDRKLAA
jgi:hypothetical protein